MHVFCWASKKEKNTEKERKENWQWKKRRTVIKRANEYLQISAFIRKMNDLARGRVHYCDRFKMVKQCEGHMTNIKIESPRKVREVAGVCVVGWNIESGPDNVWRDAVSGLHMKKIKKNGKNKACWGDAQRKMKMLS